MFQKIDSIKSAAAEMVIRGECGSKRGGHFEPRVWRLISTIAADGIRPGKKNKSTYNPYIYSSFILFATPEMEAK